MATKNWMRRPPRKHLPILNSSIHKIDEHVRVTELMGLIDLYYEIMRSLLVRP